MAIYIERGYTTGIGRFSTITTSRAVTQENSFVIIYSSSSDTTTQGANRWLISGSINSDGDLYVVKGSDSTATGAVSYVIVSCDEQEFTTQIVEQTFSAPNLAISIPIPVPVDTSNTMVIASCNSATTVPVASTAQMYATFELTDSSTVTATRAASGTYTLATKVQIISWSSWTGVKVFHGTDTISSNISSKTAFPHGISDINSDFTWLLTSFRHSTAGLEQCAIGASLVDGSGTANSENIYYQRYDQAATYSSVISWCLVRFPDDSILITHVASDDSGTGLTNTITIGGSSYMYPEGAFVVFTNSCNGTGTGFGRHVWIDVGFTLQTIGIGIGSIMNVILSRGYSGQACEHEVQFIDLGNFRPQNPSMMHGVLA
jgi:hypothetical protein